MTLPAKIEALLFISPRPLSLNKLAQLTGTHVEQVETALKAISTACEMDSRGLRLLRHAQSVQMVSSPEAAKLVAEFIKEEQRSELTKPALETLTIIAYRGPIAKVELDTIRGVNCSLIIRNLLIKGLIESSEEKRTMTTRYSVTFDFLRWLGLNSVEGLPDYQKLNKDVSLDKLLAAEEGTAAQIPSEANTPQTEPAVE